MSKDSNAEAHDKCTFSLFMRRGMVMLSCASECDCVFVFPQLIALELTDRQTSFSSLYFESLLVILASFHENL
jgi:hypothetical protein